MGDFHMTDHQQLTKIVYALLGHDDNIEFGEDYHPECKQEADEAITKLEALMLTARLDELDKVKLVTYREEMVRYADKRIAFLTTSEGKEDE
jgi:hypothetical protein